MKKTLITLSVLLSGLFVLNNSLFAQKEIRIIMIGDNTMAKFVSEYDYYYGDAEEKPLSDPFTQRGWGEILPSYFSEKVKVENDAIYGSSTRSFIDDNGWIKAMTKFRGGEYLIIQFGQNDALKSDTTRYTTPEQYEKNLVKFIKEAKKNGVRPILCTPIAKRQFDSHGNFLDSHNEYVDIMHEVAKKERVPLVDMYEKSSDLIADLGREDSQDLFLRVKPSGISSEERVDESNLNGKGATEIADIFIDALKELKFKDLLKELRE